MMWLLGDFDRDELRNPAALGFMIFSLFLTVLVMLNLVIAVRAIAHPRDAHRSSYAFYHGSTKFSTRTHTPHLLCG